MRHIRIIKTPPSELASEFIRKEWIGIQIPLATAADFRKYPLSNVSLGSSNAGGHVVVRAKAIEALEAANRHEAAEFWSRQHSHYLRFSQDVCELA